MLLSLGPSGALLMDHWGAGGFSDGQGVSLPVRGDDFLPRPPRNRPSHATFLDGVPQAYPISGDPSFKEPCLGVVYADGARIARLELRKDRITSNPSPPAPGKTPPPDPLPTAVERGSKQPIVSPLHRNGEGSGEGLFRSW